MTASRGGSRTSRAAAGPGLSGAGPSTPSARPAGVSPWGLLRAAHGGPTVAVTTLVAVLAAGREVGLATGLLLVAAVFTGQLTIGWVNDLVDLRRDREVGRTDKPLATGELPVAAVRVALAAGGRRDRGAVAGPRRGAARWSTWSSSSGRARPTTSGSSGTVLSWVPYAVAFGTLPAVVTLAGPAPRPGPRPG